MDPTGVDQENDDGPQVGNTPSDLSTMREIGADLNQISNPNLLCAFLNFFTGEQSWIEK